MKKINVLFVCLGNICRSPLAHGIFDKMVYDASLQNIIGVDSAGTAAWHIGKSPDPRSCATAEQNAYDLSALKARQVCAQDFIKFDYIFAMDFSNLHHLEDMKAQLRSSSENNLAKLDLLLSYLPNSSVTEVPDPYYGGEQGFLDVFNLIEKACESLLKNMTQMHQLS